MDKRKERQELIIIKATETFLEKGLFNTVMDDIADNAGLTRRTLYRYFETKEDLAYETTISLLNEWNDYQKFVFNTLEGSGIERLDFFLNQLIDYMNNRIEAMKFLGEFDFYFQDGTMASPSSDSIARYNEIILDSDMLLTEIIHLGEKDGSIKRGLDVKLSVVTISNILWSFGQRIAIRGNAILQESGFHGVEIIKNQVTMYVTAMRRN